MKRQLFSLGVIVAVGFWACGSRSDESSVPTNELPCDTSALRIALMADPLYIEAMDPNNPFYRFMEDTDTTLLDSFNLRFIDIHERISGELSLCSDDYLQAFDAEPMVKKYAVLLCEQMALTQMLNQKYPCIMQLSEEDRFSVLSL